MGEATGPVSVCDVTFICGVCTSEGESQAGLLCLSFLSLLLQLTLPWGLCYRFRVLIFRAEKEKSLTQSLPSHLFQFCFQLDLLTSTHTLNSKLKTSPMPSCIEFTSKLSRTLGSLGFPEQCMHQLHGNLHGLQSTLMSPGAHTTYRRYQCGRGQLNPTHNSMGKYRKNTLSTEIYHSQHC